jgi:hypothetical protein
VEIALRIGENEYIILDLLFSLCNSSYIVDEICVLEYYIREIKKLDSYNSNGLSGYGMEFSKSIDLLLENDIIEYVENNLLRIKLKAFWVYHMRGKVDGN